MKWILTVSTIFFFGLSAALYFDRDKKITEKEILAERAAVAELKNTELRDSLAMPFTKEVIFHAKDKRTKDFFTFMKVGRGYNVGYEIITDLKGIDRTAFDFVYWVCVDSIPDHIDFLIETLWLEGRMGTNIAHAQNKDGTKDGGWFGINYKDARDAMHSSPYTDVFKFIKKVRLFEQLEIPRKEWRSRYSNKYLWQQDLKRGVK